MNTAKQPVDEEAAEGSKITVYTAPKSFCKVKSISVETADGKKVDVTDNGDGSYSIHNAEVRSNRKHRVRRRTLMQLRQKPTAKVQSAY